MDRKDHKPKEVSAILHGIVLEKLKAKARLSKDEHWYYLTQILKVSQDEAEKMMERGRVETHAKMHASSNR